MKRFAIVGEDITHKFIYPGFINGFDRDRMERDGEWMADIFRGQSNRPLDDNVRVVAIASSDQDSARRIAGVTGIETVVEKVEELAVDLDGVLVMERQGKRHLALARPFLERGQYVYFDKPVVERMTEWEEILAISARTGSRVFGGSALRYSPILAKVRADLANRSATSVVVTGPGPWYDYACHTVEVLQILYGSKVKHAVGVGTNDQGVASILWREGGLGTVQWGPYRGEFRIDVYDQVEDGHRQYIINDARDYYRGLSQAIVDGVLGNIQSDYEAMGAIVGILDDVGGMLAQT